MIYLKSFLCESGKTTSNGGQNSEPSNQAVTLCSLFRKISISISSRLESDKASWKY